MCIMYLLLSRNFDGKSIMLIISRSEEFDFGGSYAE